MNSHHKMQTVFGMILRNWTVLLCFEIVYKIIGISFLFPFFEYSLSLLPKMIGENYLSQENILKLLYNPLAVLLIIGICLLAGLFIYFELTALILYSEKGWSQERITVWGLLKETAVKTAELLLPKRLPVFLFLPVMLLSAFAMASSYMRLFQVPEFIMEYLVGNRPLFILLMAVIVLFHLLFFSYLFGLPALLLNKMSFLNSWRESLRLLREKKLRTIGSLLFCTFIFMAILSGVAVVCICLLAGGVRLFYGADSGREQFRMYFLSWSGVWRLAASSLMSVIFCALIVVLYHQYRGEPRAESIKTSRTLKRLAGRTAVILCTLVVLLLFGESEAGGRIWHPAELATKVIAHRAGAAFAPENTVAALEQAITDKADIAEIDVQQLKDGTLIVMHDAGFKRTTGMDLPVWEAEYEQVKNLDAGSYFSYEFAGEPVPTLEDMLAAAKGRIQLMIELKPTGYEQNMVEGVLALIEKNEMQKQCMIASMSLELLQRVKELAPEMQTVYISVLLLSERYDLEHLDAYSVETTALTRSLVVQAHSQGKQVYAWTANSEKTMQKILNCQADGLVTDNSALAFYYLDTLGKNLILESAIDLFFPEKNE